MNLKVLCVLISRAAIVCAVLALALPAHARPVRYRLTSGAVFEQGCFDPCLCPLWVSPTTGRFRLTPISITGTYDTYSVTNINWRIGNNGDHITGQGVFTRFNEFAALNRLELDLAVGSNAPEHFDSGMVAAGALWPLINVTISIHGMYCYDTAIVVKARPIFGDVNDDGTVNVNDLLAVINAWGPCPAPPDTCPADVAPIEAADSVIDVNDLLTVINNWG